MIAIVIGFLVLGSAAIGYVSAKLFPAPLCYAVSFLAGSAWGLLISTAVK
jgi:hypothetical protein